MTHDPLCEVLEEAGFMVAYLGAAGSSNDTECLSCNLIAKVRAEYENPSCVWGQAVCVPNCPTCRRLDSLLAERSAGYEEVQQCRVCGAVYADAGKHSAWHAQQPGERFDVSRHLTTCPYGRWVEHTPVGEFLGPCDCGVML